MTTDMKTASTRRALLAAGAFALAAFTAPAPALAQDLPDANDLIEAYVAAIGGAELYADRSSVARGTFSMPAMGIQGDFVLAQRAPNQMRMDVSIPGIGEIQSGFTGEVGWSLNPMMGAQLMEGDELTQMREQATVAASLRDASVVPGRETVERSEFEGEACWRVKLTWASGRESHDCYSVGTGLLVASESVQASPMGDMPSVTIYREYREFEGRRMPTRLIQRAAGQEQVMVIESVEYGAVSDAQVAPPQQIQALIDG